MTCQRCGKPLSGRATKWCSANCLKRASDERHRANCSECGKPMSARTGWSAADRPNAKCIDCENAARAMARAERRSLIQGMWADGRSVREIAAALDSTANATEVEMNAMRADGWDLPYRYRVGPDGRRLPNAA